jgi:glucose/mannose-6-phosphate isomerase
MPLTLREVILGQAEQITHSATVNQGVTVDNTVDGLVLAGLGGSGHPGDLLQALGLTTVPLTIHRNYGLPELRFDNPLIIASSYSGNTEETLSAYEAARAAGYHLLINTAGGQLLKLSQDQSLPLSKIDYPGLQPRHTLLASFTSLYTVLKNSGLAHDIDNELVTLSYNLTALIPTLEDPARRLAQELADKVPLFYSSDALSFAAKNFKIQTNENAKYPAFWNTFPELNHNEMVGFSKLKDLNHPNRYHVVFLRSASDHPQVRLRMNITAELYTDWGVGVSFFDVPDTGQLSQIIHTVLFGLWTTMFLAEHYGLDPIPVAGVEDFKQKLAKLS